MQMPLHENGAWGGGGGGGGCRELTWRKQLDGLGDVLYD